jgi:tetratricopeptide (TPR) repeat protein
LFRNQLKTCATAVATSFLIVGGALGATEQEFKDCGGSGSKDPSQVVAGCTSVLKVTFDDKSITAMAYYRRGFAYSRLKETDKSLQDYDEALKIDAKFVPALFQRGSLYYMRNNYDRSLDDFNQAIAASPEKSAFFHHMRGRVFVKKMAWKEALADFNEAISINPRMGQAYLERADVQLSLGNRDAGLADLDKSIEVDPSNDFAFFRRANSLRARGQFDKAIADFDKAIQLSPDAMYYAGRAHTYKRMGDLANARRDADEAMKRGWKTDEAR